MPAPKEPLWASALLAADPACVDSGVRVEWRYSRDSLRFTNPGLHPVFISQLGVRLEAGRALDVRWPAGATAYEYRMVKPS